MGSLCEQAEVKPFWFHAIRHLTSSTLYKMGYVVAEIQGILRHESATTTTKYIKSPGREVQIHSPRPNEIKMLAISGGPFSFVQKRVRISKKIFSWRLLRADDL